MKKKLLEKRQELKDKMEKVLNSAKSENRAMNESEISGLDKLE